MANPTSGFGRFLAEALIVVPALALGLAWAGVTLAGLMDPTLIDRHGVEIARVMTLLLTGCVACFAAGLVLFALTRGSRPVDAQ
jgi:hypothetical protein